MSVLITGGAGFIGSHIAHRLLKEGQEVIILDNLSTGFRENIPAGARFLHLDLSDESFVGGLKDIEADAVIHMAAQSSGEISFDNPVYDLRTNTLGTLLLLKWSLEHEVKKFVFTSSMTAYGDGTSTARVETDPVRPKSFYGVGKCASEYYINIFADMGLDTTILRLFNIYGPGQNMENLRQGMVSIYMAYIAQNQPILVKGPLDRFRDFVYIDDVMRAVDMAMKNPRSRGGTFNVCTGRKVLVSELLGIIMEAFGHPRGTYPVTTGPRTPRDQDGVYGSYDLIRSRLGWEPTVTLEEGVARMAAWVKEYYRRKAGVR
jgi:UDP-glucose 4-epimerase